MLRKLKKIFLKTSWLCGGSCDFPQNEVNTQGTEKYKVVFDETEGKNL